jgi:ribose transport system ATP-binding protein
VDVRASLLVRGITKSYPGVRALDGVNLAVNRGEIHGVVGENGAGKSTLMAVVSGAIRPDAGSVVVGGHDLLPVTPSRARELGVAIVRQEPALMPDLSVAENLLLKVPPARRPASGAARRWAEECLTRWDPDLKLDVGLRVEQITAEQRFIVEIVGALTSLPEVLILDEPTEHLGREDVERLFAIVRNIALTGCAVVYISHRIREVRAICSSLTVLRDGAVQGTFAVDELTEDDIVTLIVGRDVDSAFPDKLKDAAGGRPRLELRQFVGAGFEPISLSVAPGEIVGLAGIEGNGQRDLLRAIAGLRRSSGTVLLDGREVGMRSRRAGLRHGIGFLPGDRHREGIFEDLSVADNIELRNLPAVSVGGIVVDRRASAVVSRAITGFDIRTPSPATPMSSLSGGNQQKVIIASVFETAPRVVLIDEPTQGVDVGAKVEIYGQLRAMAEREGVAVVLVSSDGFELAGLCDRVLVFSRGSVLSELSGAEVTESAILSATLRADTHRASTKARRRLDWLSGDAAPAVLIAALVVGLAVVSGILNPFYASGFNIASLLAGLLPLAALAIGQATVMMTGGIDLSNGPLMGFLIVIASFFVVQGAGPGQQAAGWVLILLIAVGVGALNWVLTELLGLPALVATLAVFFALQALSLLLRPSPGGAIDARVADAISFKIGGVVPAALLVLVAIVVAMQFALLRSVAGVRLRAVGSFPDRAALTGARPAMIRLVAYVVSSLAAAVGAILLMAQIRTGDPSTGTSYTLSSISAAVIGGTSLFGGRGSYVGVLLGAVLVQQVIGAIPFLQLPSEWQYFAVGLLTLGAVALFSKSRQSQRAE